MQARVSHAAEPGALKAPCPDDTAPKSSVLSELWVSLARRSRNDGETAHGARDAGSRSDTGAHGAEPRSDRPAAPGGPPPRGAGRVRAHVRRRAGAVVHGAARLAGGRR